MFRWRRVYRTFLLFLLLVASACTYQEGTKPQDCPDWTRNGGDCMLAIENRNDATTTAIRLQDWDKLRMTVIGGDFVFLDPSNIKVSREDGTIVDVDADLLSPGVFIVERIDVENDGVFYLNERKSTNTVSANLEYATLLEKDLEE